MLTTSPGTTVQLGCRQTYIAFGVAITAAAIEKVDATPWKGSRTPSWINCSGSRKRIAEYVVADPGLPGYGQ